MTSPVKLPILTLLECAAAMHDEPGFTSSPDPTRLARAQSPTSPTIACAEGLISLNSTAPGNKRAREADRGTDSMCCDGNDSRRVALTAIPEAEKEKRARNMMPPPMLEKKRTESKSHGAMELVLDSPRVAERHCHWRAELRTELLTASLAYALGRHYVFVLIHTPHAHTQPEPSY